jgi:diguanylate cyclase (GGDEF)-like protein
VDSSFGAPGESDRPNSSRSAYPVPLNEAGRVSSLRLLKLLGVEDDPWWEVLTRLAAQICGTRFAVVNLIEATYQYSLAPFGHVAAPADRGDSMCATSIVSATPSFTADARLDVRWADNPFVTGELGEVRTYVAAPLMLPTGHTIGTICAFSHTVIEVSPGQISGLSDLAALTVRMLEIRERSLQFSLAATRDPLTELPNRALMSETLAQNLLRHARHEANVAAVFIDLNDFKPFNDTYGHGVGDELLRAVARRLLIRVRSSDLVARVGGDEFVIVCSSVPDDAVAWTIDRVVEEVRMAFVMPFILSVGPVEVGASVGIAYAQSPRDSTDAILDRANKAMYVDKARRTTRN